MQGDYPGFKVPYTDEELAEHFLLTPAERALVETRRGDVNRHGMAVLLKTIQYLGYFPEELPRCRRRSAPSSRISSSSCGTIHPPIRAIPVRRRSIGHLAGRGYRRKHLSPELGFSKAHHDLNIRRIGFVASEITKNGGIAICAPIAPYDNLRQDVRAMVEPGGGLVLVYMATPAGNL